MTRQVLVEAWPRPDRRYDVYAYRFRPGEIRAARRVLTHEECERLGYLGHRPYLEPWMPDYRYETRARRDPRRRHDPHARL